MDEVVAALQAAVVDGERNKPRTALTFGSLVLGYILSLGQAELPFHSNAPSWREKSNKLHTSVPNLSVKELYARQRLTIQEHLQSKNGRFCSTEE